MLLSMGILLLLVIMRHHMKEIQEVNCFMKETNYLNRMKKHWIMQKNRDVI